MNEGCPRLKVRHYPFLPDETAVLIPGYYLCFIFTEGRVPSTGKFVQICTASGSVSDWSRYEWWNRMDWRIRNYLPIDLIGAERLRDLLRQTLGEEEQASGAELAERLEALETKLLWLEHLLRNDKDKKKDKDTDRDEDHDDGDDRDHDHGHGSGH